MPRTPAMRRNARVGGIGGAGRVEIAGRSLRRLLGAITRKSAEQMGQLFGVSEWLPHVGRLVGYYCFNARNPHVLNGLQKNLDCFTGLA